MKRFSFWIGAITLAMLPAVAIAQTPPAPSAATIVGTGQGNLTIDGKPIPLRYVYAVMVDNVEEEGLMLSGPSQYLVLLFSDRALPKSLVENRNAPQGDLRSPMQVFDPSYKSLGSQINGLRFKIDPTKKTLSGFQLLFPTEGVSFESSGDVAPEHRLTGLTVSGGKVSGTVLVTEAKQHPKSYGEDENKKYKGPKKYQYRVAFQAPIQTEPAVTQNLTGKEALASEPGKVLSQYVAAGTKGDVAGVRRLTAASHKKFLDKPGVAAQLKQMKLNLLEKQVKRIVIRGNEATIVVVSEEPNYSQVMLHLTREAEGWKLYFP